MMPDPDKPSAATQAATGLLPTLSIHAFQPDQRLVDEALGLTEVLDPDRRDAMLQEQAKRFEQPDIAAEHREVSIAESNRLFEQPKFG